MDRLLSFPSNFMAFYEYSWILFAFCGIMFVFAILGWHYLADIRDEIQKGNKITHEYLDKMLSELRRIKINTQKGENHEK